MNTGLSVLPEESVGIKRLSNGKEPLLMRGINKLIKTVTDRNRK